jgi:excisionase family DNA binding protein
MYSNGEFLTVNAAAKILNVPADYVLELLTAETLPYVRQGEEYFLLRAPLEAYKRKTYLEASKALDEISREAWEMGLYD